MAQHFTNGRKADGLATIFAIATTNPPNTIEQKTFPDRYFGLTQSEHLVDLKNKFQRICDKTAIRKRHVLWDDDLIRSNPCLWTPSEPSLNLRQRIAVEAVPRLGAEAAEKAIEEWGQPKSAITHLIFCTTSAVDLPGSDFKLVHLLGLDLSVQRFMLTHQGCSAGGTVLRLAKSIAESNKGARILTVSSETTIAFVKEPHDERGNLVAHAIFGDGAVSTVVGSNSFLMEGERPLFSIFSTSQVILPNSKDSICVHMDDRGLDVQILKDVPLFILKHIEECLQKSFAPLGISDWNSVFWSCHPGGRAILDRVEERLCLKQEKLHAARHVLSEYGNMASACVLFILDEVRKRSLRNGHTTTGEGFEWGVLLGMGPGISVETVVLKSYPIP